MAMVADDRARAALTLQTQADALLRAQVDARNREHLDAMFTPDPHWINIVGMHWRGRSEVALARRAFLDITFRGVNQRLVEIEIVTPLPGGGAVVVARLAVDPFRQPNGVMKAPSEDRLTLVLVPRGEELAIVHSVNVGIVAEAQADDPARRRE